MQFTNTCPPPSFCALHTAYTILCGIIYTRVRLPAYNVTVLFCLDTNMAGGDDTIPNMETAALPVI